MPTIIEDFESGSLSSEFITRDNRFNIESTTAYNGNNSVKMDYSFFDSGGSTAPSSPNLATFVPTEINGGGQPDYIEWYWQETNIGSYGGGIRIRDSAGNTVGGFLTNNPQWDVQTGSGSFTEIFSGDGVNRWIRFKMEFDYSNNQVTYTGEDLTSGSTVTETFSSVNNFSDVEKIDFMDYTAGEYSAINSNGNGNLIEMWWDDFTVSGLTADPSVTTDTATNITVSESTLKGTVDNLGGQSNVNTFFDYRQVGDSSYNTVSVGSQSSTGSYSTTVSSLKSGTDYEYRSRIQDSSGNTLDSGSLVTFTTDQYVFFDSVNVNEISADFSGSFDSDKSFSNLDLGFKIYDNSDNLVETLNTENIDTSNVTLPYTYSDSTDILQDGTTYNVEAFATDLSTSTTYTSDQISFTTGTYRTPDASGSFVQVTTAPDCNVTDYKGSGIASNPYIVQNAQQLYCMRQEPDAVYKINNKIDASYVNYDPISYFSGRIIGDNETIYNLETSLIETNVGLIESLKVANSTYEDGLVKNNQGGTINDTAVRNVTVTGTDQVGGIVGDNSGNIERCLVVNSTIDASGNAVGGLVGRSTLRTPNSYVKGTTVTGDQKVGGLAGIIVKDNVFDVHTGDTAVTGNAELGAVVGDYNGNDAFDAYFDDQVGYKLDDKATGLTTSDMTGDTAPNNMDLDFSNVWGVVIDPSDDYPVLQTNDIPPAEPNTINNPDDTTDYDDPDDTENYTDFTLRTRFKLDTSDNFVENFEDMVFNALTTGNNKNIETVKVGSDGSDTTASMNDIQTVIQSGSLDKDVNGRQVNFYAVFLAKNLSSDVEEIGFFNQSGDLIYRIVFDTPKSASERQEFETTYTID